MSVQKMLEEAAREAVKEAERAVDLGKHDVAARMHRFAAQLHEMIHADLVPESAE